jgi:outer membrane protein insertion porin family
VLPGYGIGLHYATGIGMVRMSYALNPEEGLSAGKVHFGLSFGL